MMDPEIAIDAPAKADINAALKEMKNGTAGGVDSLTAEILKADLGTYVDILHCLLLRIRCGSKNNCQGTESCGNWRGITLMAVAAKVLVRIIITRIRDGVDSKLAGFRKGRGTVEQIYILRNIIEQTIEWNSNLYVCFVDFKEGF